MEVGGRQPGVKYEMNPPRSYGQGRWPASMTFEHVSSALERQMLEFWRDLVTDIRDRRTALGLSQPDAAARAGLALNTYEAIERGDAWGTVPSLLKIVFALELDLEQTVDFRVRRRRDPASTQRGNRLGRDD